MPNPSNFDTVIETVTPISSSFQGSLGNLLRSAHTNPGFEFKLKNGNLELTDSANPSVVRLV